ncbi:hypothetical protein G3M53_21340 [Streptomyces sp. SID7982]|nr:hypothetical protein [Streptomyces sp. SID7982]
MVAHLRAAGQLRPGPVREALLALRREVLIPQAYVRRSDPRGGTAAMGPADRLQHLPDATVEAADRPGSAVLEFAERAVGRITEWTDTSWARTAGQVWRASNLQGSAWYAKVHRNERFHSREVRPGPSRENPPARPDRWCG